MDKRELVGNLLEKYFNVPKTLTFWDIIDTVDDLILIHYNRKFDTKNPEHEPLKQIRDIIFDLNKQQIVAKSNEFVEKIEINEPLEEKDGTIIIGDKKFDGGKLFIQYESFSIMVFKHNKNIYISTYLTINRDKTFKCKEIFINLSGINIENLFGEEEYSPYCYKFLVTNVFDEKVIYDGYSKMWENGTYETTVEPKLRESGLAQFCGAKLVNFELFNGGDNLIEQKPISVELANKIIYPLKYATIDNVNLLNRELYYKYNKSELVDVLFNNKGKDLCDDIRTHGGDLVKMVHD